MDFSLRHLFSSTKPDGADATLIQPSNWNEEHAIVGELPIANGGTGAASAAAARTALGLAIGSNIQAYIGYQEADWTPSISCAAPGTLAITYTTQIGKMTRIGRQVTVSFVITINSITVGTASGEIYVTGLLYGAMASIGGQGSMYIVGIDAVTSSPLTSVWSINSGTSRFVCRQSIDAAAATAIDISGLSAGDSLLGTVTYFTSDAFA